MKPEYTAPPGRASQKGAGTTQSERAGVIIETHDVWRKFQVGDQEILALRGVNMRLGASRLVALVGRSGSGKSTLLNCLAGLDRPTSGNIQAFGREITSFDAEQLTDYRRRQLGFIFQSFGLLPNLSAYENVELILRIIGKPRRERRQQVMRTLELVGLSKWTRHRPYELSGGQKQRVAIARALAAQPRLILADEPTGELDSNTAREIFTLFRQITRQEGISVLTATHDPLVREYADDIILMNDGQCTTAG
jgi:ABC-type lipoprotein export system ATPase subunit